MFRTVKKVHFVGIGGIGMSGIAELLINLDFQITGSDLNDSELIRHLKSKGATISKGHHAKNLTDADVLVYSSAVKQDNPEIVESVKRGIPVIRRAEMLGELIAVKETSIGVGGTHGKTSTSFMIGNVLSAAEIDPTLVVGGLVKTLGTNSILGAGDTIVVEADEYDRSFLALRPTISVITNIELEHTDCYESLEDLQNAFIQFSNSVPFYGVVIACIDSPSVRKILPEVKRPIITYGISENTMFRAVDISFLENSARFTVNQRGEKLGEVTLNVPGEHNVLNSLAAIALGIEMGIPFNTIAEGLETYSGVRRRFETKGIVNDIMVIDDYAHHPTEVLATLQAAKSGWSRRIIAVFQPHLYSRTRDFHQDFAKAFLDSDVLIVTDIYPAREESIPGVTGELVSNAAKKLGHPNVQFLKHLDDLSTHIETVAQPGDMIITMGAGTIWRYSETLVEHLSNYFNHVD